eukprot:3015567-Rhodomonas_salina.2
MAARWFFLHATRAVRYPALTERVALFQVVDIQTQLNKSEQACRELEIQVPTLLARPVFSPRRPLLPPRSALAACGSGSWAAGSVGHALARACVDREVCLLCAACARKCTVQDQWHRSVFCVAGGRGGGGGGGGAAAPFAPPPPPPVAVLLLLFPVPRNQGACAPGRGGG